MVTITCAATQFPSVAEAETEQRKAWAAYCRAWARQHPHRKIPYSLAREYTKAGWPHLHVLIRGVWIDRHELKKFMGDRIGSPIVDVRKIDSHRGVVGYVAKYVGKSYERRGTGKRYWCSKDWDLTKVKQPDGSYRSVAEHDGFREQPIRVSISHGHTSRMLAELWISHGCPTYEVKPNHWSTAPPAAAAQEKIGDL